MFLIAFQAGPHEWHIFSMKGLVCIQANVLAVGMKPLLTLITRDGRVIFQSLEAIGTIRKWKSVLDLTQSRLKRSQATGTYKSGTAMCFLFWQVLATVCFLPRWPRFHSRIRIVYWWNAETTITPGWCEHKLAITRLPNVCGTIKMRICCMYSRCVQRIQTTNCENTCKHLLSKLYSNQNGRSVTSGQGQQCTLLTRK